MAHLDMGGVIDHLSTLILNEFPETFSQAYFGDVGIYPPKAFQSPTGEWRSVLVFQPRYDKLEDKTRTGASEVRRLGLEVVIMVNMVPFFEALPSAAFGERELVSQIMMLRGYLSRDDFFTLGDRVLGTYVGDVNWSWQQRGNTAIRSAAISYEARSVQPRM